MSLNKLFKLTKIKHISLQKRYTYDDTIKNIKIYHHTCDINFCKAGHLLAKLKFNREYQNGDKLFQITFSKEDFSKYEQVIDNYIQHRHKEIQEIINWVKLMEYDYINDNYKLQCRNAIYELKELIEEDILDRDIEYKILHKYNLIDEFYKYIENNI